MVMASSHAKEISEVIRRMRRKEALEKYWDKIAIKEDGYVMARTMEIEYVRIGRMKENTNEEKGVKATQGPTLLSRCSNREPRK